MVSLTPFDLKNLPTHYNWDNDKELNYFDSEYPFQHESFESFSARIKSVIDPENTTSQLLEIHRSDTDELIGVIDIHGIDYHNSRCNLECTIGKREDWRKGYGCFAMQSALEYCFEELGMNRVNTTAFDFNKPWIKLVKKLGFRQEGKLRQHVWKNDGFHDKLLFGILHSEYDAEAVYSVVGKSAVS